MRQKERKWCGRGKKERKFGRGLAEGVRRRVGRTNNTQHNTQHTTHTTHNTHTTHTGVGPKKTPRDKISSRLSTKSKVTNGTKKKTTWRQKKKWQTGQKTWSKWTIMSEKRARERAGRRQGSAVEPKPGKRGVEGWGVEVGGRRVGPKFRAFFPLPTLFLFFFSNFRRASTKQKLGTTGATRANW